MPRFAMANWTYFRWQWSKQKWGGKKKGHNMLYIEVEIYLSQRVIPSMQPDHKQHEKAVKREERQQWDVSVNCRGNKFEEDRPLAVLIMIYSISAHKYITRTPTLFPAGFTVTFTPALIFFSVRYSYWPLKRSRFGLKLMKPAENLPKTCSAAFEGVKSAAKKQQLMLKPKC